MKKQFTFLQNVSNVWSIALIAIFMPLVSPAQTTEQFEDEAEGSTGFSDGRNSFSITGKMDIAYYPGWGVDGSNYFVDNYQNLATSSPEDIASIQSPGNNFYAHSLYLFPSEDGINHSTNGSANLIGKLNGTVKFTQTVNSGDWGVYPSDNYGFAYIDFSANGYDAVKIDELVFQVGGSLTYLAFDNFEYSIAASNAAPTASDFSTPAGPYQNLVYTFATADFGYSDGDSDPLNHIRVTAIPSNGVLYVDADNDDNYDAGEELSGNSQVSKSDLDAGNLQYITTGSGSVSFTFDVNDGTDYSASAYTATLNVVSEPAVTLSVGATGIDEESGSTSVTATLSHEFPATVTVNLAFSGTATLTGDYTFSGTSIAIASGTTGSVTLTSVSDAIYETDETVIIEIESVTNGSENGIQEKTITIADDDAMPVVSFAEMSSDGSESAASADVQVLLSAISGLDVTVDYTVTGTATGGGVDYTLADGSVLISAGNTSETITIADIVDDDIAEGSETVIITLSNPVNASAGLNTDHTYTINDNDDISTAIGNVSESIINVYPNPFTDRIYFDNPDKISTISISNLSGQEVFEMKNQNAKSIDLEHLKRGIYFVTIESRNNGKTIVKIIKK